MIFSKDFRVTLGEVSNYSRWESLSLQWSTVLKKRLRNTILKKSRLILLVEIWEIIKLNIYLKYYLSKFLRWSFKKSMIWARVKIEHDSRGSHEQMETLGWKVLLSEIIWRNTFYNLTLVPKSGLTELYQSTPCIKGSV